MTNTQYEGSTFNEEQYEVGTEAFKGVLSTVAPSESLGALDIRLWQILREISEVQKLLQRDFKFLGDARPQIKRGIERLEEIARGFETDPL